MHEIYPNTPLALVACEIRIPSSSLPLYESQRSGFAKRLRDLFPIHNTEEHHRISAPDGSVSAETRERFQSRDRTTSVSVRPAALVLETTAHEGWDERFRPMLASLVEAATDLLDPPGVSRLGLRYVNEIRLPLEAEDPSIWDDYVQSPLTQVRHPGEVAGLQSRGWEGLIVYESKAGTLVVRYGPRSGYAVNPEGPLRRPSVPPLGKPYFLLDIDSFWEPQEEIPEWSADQLLDRSDALHTPIYDLFEASITESLRDILRQHNGGNA